LDAYRDRARQATLHFVNLRLLIDGIVRQTTILIAQLSTSEGTRAPLAHVADQVFVELAREIEAQGVRRQVAADMFGMALRSYQKKMRRLTESESVREKSLWEAVLEVVENEQPTRDRVQKRFEYDGEREVAAVLKDLVTSGLVSVTGTGAHAVYAATSESVREKLRSNSVDSLANLAWLKIFRREVVSPSELPAALGVSEAIASEVMAELEATGRVNLVDGVLEASNVVLPLGAEHGWEVAVLDHFRTVAVAIAAKVRDGRAGSKLADKLGGSTFTFTVTPGHPYEQEVYGLLRKTRLSAQQLWEKVAAHNGEYPPAPEAARRVSFYVGQTLEMSEE